MLYSHDDIKIQRLEPFTPSFTEAERLALLMAGKWAPMPARWMTREEIAREYPELA